MIKNEVTPEGKRLGREMARLTDVEIAKRGVPDERCATCAFRAGPHIANGSPWTLMDAVKCIAERVVFQCHEQPKACAGWKLAVFDKPIAVPWGFTGGVD